MEQGIIKKIFTDRNIGFISSDSGDIFFHKTVVEGTVFEELQEGQAVEYESEDGPMGPKATVVRAADGEGQTVEFESEDGPASSQDVAERAIDRIEAQTAEHESEGGSEASRNTAEHESEDDTSSKPTVNYVVAVFKMVKRKSHDRIRVLSKETFEKIAEGGDVKQLLKTSFDHWVENEGFEGYETKLEAWIAAIEKSKSLSKEGSRFELKRGKKERCVYVFEMNPTVIKKSSKFRKMNDNVLSKNSNPRCVYVGETSKKPRQRFKCHRSKKSKSSTKWGQKFFLPTFEKAYCKNLLLKFQETDHSISGLNTYQALKQELALRKWLQEEKGIAAYSN